MVFRRRLALSILAAGLPAFSQAADLGEASQIRGAAALARINRSAMEVSRLDRFVGGEQVFNYAPGRLYEVRTAPLRVTTLTLGRGETITALAGGDTAQWQIGQASSGEGTDTRQHVLVKPFEEGLETNLVVTTNRRVYLISLLSGPAAGFNAAVAWAPEPSASPVTASPPATAEPVMLPTQYAILPKGKAPAWSPLAVATDGERTYITFADTFSTGAAPILRVLEPSGRPTIVNYRQVGQVFVVDGVIEAAELRLGDKPAQEVRIHRLPEGRP
jgi:type IV secretion system protein TrbG